MEMEEKGMISFKKGDCLGFEYLPGGGLLFSAAFSRGGKLRERDNDNKILFSSASRRDIISILQLLEAACGIKVKLWKGGDTSEHYIVE